MNGKRCILVLLMLQKRKDILRLLKGSEQLQKQKSIILKDMGNFLN